MESRIVLTFYVALFAILVAIGICALGVPFAPSLVLSGVAAVVARSKLAPRVSCVDGAWKAKRKWAFLWALLASLALGQTVRLATFAVSPERTEMSVLPWSRFMTTHSCASAYFEAARFADEHRENIYDPSLYDPMRRRKLGGFVVDIYEYPPPFLLVPRVFFAFSDSFERFRLLGISLQGILALGALLAVARHVGGVVGTRLVLWAPLVWATIPLQLTLQIGNFQLAALTLSILAMAAFAFHRRLAPVGGALLGYVIVSKVFPGVLLLYLVARRRWSPAAWTSGWAVLFLLVAWLVLGSQPFAAFWSFQLPRLASGAAFPMMRADPWSAAINFAPSGLAFKAYHLGWISSPNAVSSIVGWIYTGGVVLGTLWIARRPEQSRIDEAGRWIALLFLATLRSPFLPHEYALIPVIWGVTLVFSTWDSWNPRRILLAVGLTAFSTLNVSYEFGSRHVAFTLIVLTAAQLVGFALAIHLVRGGRYHMRRV